MARCKFTQLSVLNVQIILPKYLVTKSDSIRKYAVSRHWCNGQGKNSYFDPKNIHCTARGQWIAFWVRKSCQEFLSENSARIFCNRRLHNFSLFVRAEYCNEFFSAETLSTTKDSGRSFRQMILPEFSVTECSSVLKGV